MSDPTMNSTASLLPAASSTPPSVVDPSLVAAAAPVATPAPTAAPQSAASVAGADSMPISADALSSLTKQITAHVHAAPAARAASVLAAVKTALDSAVAVHTSAVAGSMVASAAAKPSEFQFVVSDITSEIGKAEVAAVAEVKKVTGVVIPRWVVGAAALIAGAGIGAEVVLRLL